MENICINLFQGIPPQIVVSITGGSKQAGLAYFGVLHGFDYF
jgi:hypothetical protein